MKKITLLLVAALFTLQTAKSQNTCLNAYNVLLNNGNIPTPPPGTISPAGPALGCLTVTERQVWFYLPVCKTITMKAFDVVGVGSSSDTGGIVVYGPFPQKITICSDLASNKILYCNQTILDLPLEYSGTDTLYEGNYYYVLVTFSQSPSLYPTFFPAFSTYDPYYLQPNCFECNNEPSVLYKNNLCLVSVDTAINKCTLTWEETPGPLSGYEIRRESTLTGIFDSITTVPIGSLSTFTDLTSSPSQRNYTYAVAGIDSCGHSNAQFINTLTSIHLISFPGANNQAQLIWNNVYAANQYIPQYYIYRNSNNAGWQVIDSIGITLSTITYTDIFAPAGINQYTVELRKLNPCIPMRTSSTAYQSAFSNVSIANVTAGVEELTNSTRISIYPNPAKDKFIVDWNYLNTNAIDFSITDMQGKNYFELKNTTNKKLVIERKNMNPGVYLVEIKADKVYRSKLVLQ